MTEDGFADIRALTELEKGIHFFGHQMANANSEIEHTIDLYFESFERGLQILEERLRRAEEDLERAERALERQRDKRVWVEDKNGNGHWKQADCSTEEARVAKCKAVRDRCRHDVDTCRQMILEARTKRYIHKEKFVELERRTLEAIDKIGHAKELVEKHHSIAVPSSMSSPSLGFIAPFSSSSSSSSISRGTDLSRPRPPMNPNPSFGPRSTPTTERPRGPQNERINPTPSRPVTDADRPRPPLGEGVRGLKQNTSSF